MSIRSIGVVGAGTMGNGITQACAATGLRVTMIDVSDSAVDRGMKTISASLDRLAAKRKLDERPWSTKNSPSSSSSASKPSTTIATRPARCSPPWLSCRKPPSPPRLNSPPIQSVSRAKSLVSAKTPKVSESTKRSTGIKVPDVPTLVIILKNDVKVI
jgi:hypothetical protein